MESNNNNAMTLAGVLLVGVVLGYVASGYVRTARPMVMSGATHTMDMGGTMDGMMSGLSGKTGADFEQAFLSEMIVHHEGAVDMAEALLVQTKRPELVTMAKAIISAQSTEIAQMKQWQKEWFTK